MSEPSGSAIAAASVDCDGNQPCLFTAAVAAFKLVYGLPCLEKCFLYGVFGLLNVGKIHDAYFQQGGAIFFDPQSKLPFTACLFCCVSHRTQIIDAEKTVFCQ